MANMRVNARERRTPLLPLRPLRPTAPTWHRVGPPVDPLTLHTMSGRLAYSGRLGAEWDNVTPPYAASPAPLLSSAPGKPSGNGHSNDPTTRFLAQIARNVYRLRRAPKAAEYLVDSDGAAAA